MAPVRYCITVPLILFLIPNITLALSTKQRVEAAFARFWDTPPTLSVMPVDCANECANLFRNLMHSPPPHVSKIVVAKKNSRVVGYGIVDNVMGKEQPITFLLITDASLHLLGVEILAYRESRGSEIQRPEWLQQFAGQDSNTTLKVGAQIRNISGATISTNAVTEGVNRLLVLLRLLTTQKLLPF